MAYTMLVTVFSLFLAAYLPAVTPLTTECSRVRSACSAQLYKDQLASMEACAAGQKYFNCLANALNTAEQTGLCDKLSLYAFRYDSLIETRSYDNNCQNFNIPASFTQPACQTEMAQCGASVLRALGASNQNDNELKCSELDGFKVCMESRTPSCPARATVQAFIQPEMTSFQYQSTCVASVTEACSRIRSTCAAQLYEEQQQNYPPCQSGQNYVNCLARVLSGAEKENTCDELALNTFRHDSFLETKLYVKNCPDFTTPAYFQLDACQQDMGTCGTIAIKVFAANRDNNDVTKCIELDGFKSCMETNTTNCADRPKINTMLQQDLTYYEYQSSCLDTTSSTTTTTTKPTITQKPVTQKPDVTSTTTTPMAKSTTTQTTTTQSTTTTQTTPTTPITTTTTTSKPTTTTTTSKPLTTTTTTTSKSTTTTATTTSTPTTTTTTSKPTTTTTTTSKPTTTTTTSKPTTTTTIFKPTTTTTISKPTTTTTTSKPLTTTTISTPTATTSTTTKPTPPPPTTTTTTSTTAAIRTTARPTSPSSTIPSTGSSGSGGTGPVVIGGEGSGGSGNRIHPFTVVTIGLALIVGLLRV